MAIINILPNVIASKLMTAFWHGEDVLYVLVDPCLAVPYAGKVAECVETIAVSISSTSYIQDPSTFQNKITHNYQSGYIFLTLRV